jgi:hypothetical protein
VLLPEDNLANESRTESCTPPLVGIYPLERALAAAEAAECGLAIDQTGKNLVERISTGSFYTPADVAGHFWTEYFRFHGASSAPEVLTHIGETQFVEPSAGAGIFLFSLLHKIVALGCEPKDLAAIRCAAVDLNEKALSFVASQKAEIERQYGIKLNGITLHHGDFRQFSAPPARSISFVGNPPYVRNGKGATWKNLYAEFLDRMLEVSSARVSVSLILPLSIAFSRDYVLLRKKVHCSSRAIRLLNFDNMPDFLFKAGKPGSLNTNKANSQRCSIIYLRNYGDTTSDATELQRWSRRRRCEFLDTEPKFHDISRYDFDNQFPRPSCEWIMGYLEARAGALRLDQLAGAGGFGFSVAGVARNFIGIRDLSSPEHSSPPLTFPSEQRMLWALQILASPVFYEYWRTVGDGFHVTRSDVERFPVTQRLLRSCARHEAYAQTIWLGRDKMIRQKMNSGKEVVSFDFRGHFDYLLDDVFNQEDVDAGKSLPSFLPHAVQSSLLDGLDLLSRETVQRARR